MTNKSSRNLTITLVTLLFSLVLSPSITIVNYALEPSNAGWNSDTVHLDWNARLEITLLTGDGRPLEGLWVYIVDAYTGEYVAAAITDCNGNTDTAFFDQDNVTTSSMDLGNRVDIGFNLLRGWFWLDKNMMLTGEPVNPEWDPVSNNIPPQPLGNEYVSYVTFNNRSGWARFYGKYYVVVYYKAAGCDEVLGSTFSQIVFDSYSNEAHHQYIYLGIKPEAVAAISDYGASQARIFRVNIGDIILSFKDAEGRPLENVRVILDQWGIRGLTDISGRLLISKVPRISYTLTAEWISKYGTKAMLKTTVIGDSIITMPVHDIVLKLLTPRGRPLVNAEVFLEDTYLGVTDAEGKVLATQVPVGNYKVMAKWFESNLILRKVNVTTSGEISLVPSNVHCLTIIVRGSMGQVIEGAGVTIWKNGAELLRGITDKGGNFKAELPDGDYTVEVSFDQFLKKTDVTLTGDTSMRVELDVFVKIFGVAITLSQAILLILAIMIIIIALAIVLHEYHIYRRKKLPQIFTVRTLEKT
jgi:hypothetical protein